VGALACAMLLRLRGLCIAGLGFLVFPSVSARFIACGPLQAKSDSLPFAVRILHETRGSPLDLEIVGDLAGQPPGAVRYLAREDLRALPQVSYTVTDDGNFSGAVQVRGVELEVLAREFAAVGEKALVVAVCDDLYQASYPRTYIQAHRPVLVLEISGEGPAGWPKSREGSGSAMGPYLISHPHFTPSFKILGHEDEAQIPWGVVRLEFQNEETYFSAIAPRGANASDPAVQAGYRIAQQNCLRCHGPADHGRLKGKITWFGIALFAQTSPRDLANYVRNPQRVTQYAQMPGNPSYDEATMQALIAYFRSVYAQEKR
jgi:mono/diheme cytochrome c family protein